METKKNYVDAEINVIFLDLNSDIVTTSSGVSVSPPNIGDVDQDSWI